MTWKHDWLDPREPATGRRHNSSSYAGGAGKALLLRDGPTLKKIEKLVSLMSVFCGLTPELSRAALRPWAGENYQNLHEAAKRARLERIVRQQHLTLHGIESKSCPGLSDALRQRIDLLD